MIKLRPGGNGTLKLIDGPLLEHAERARGYPDIPHVMIIEEFNRGNPAQALGEMLTLLERSKRNESDALELAYMFEDEEPIWLPDNLYVIGTMNKAIARWHWSTLPSGGGSPFSI